MATPFGGMFSAILKVIDVVSIIILVIMMLILGNTIAMGVRERTHEYGTLLALGFEPAHIGRLIVLESAFVGLLGGIAGTLFGDAHRLRDPQVARGDADVGDPRVLPGAAGGDRGGPRPRGRSSARSPR